MRTERHARQATVAAISAAVWAIAFWITGSPATSLWVAGALFVILWFSWVLFAFEATADYRMNANRDALGMAGEHGVIVEECAPSGSVRVHGEVWQAVAADSSVRLAPGEEIVVKETTGLVLRVARREPASA